MNRAANPQTIDEEQLSELLEILDTGPADDGVGQAIVLFLTTLPRRLDDLGRAVASGRYADAGRLAHSVRGSASAFAASRLAWLAGEVEDRCDGAAPDGAGMRELTAALDAEFATFRRALEARMPDFTNAGGATTAPGSKDGSR